MTLATIAKEFTFHSAHRLPNHDGQCKNLHGHSYKLEVLVTGPVKGQNGDPDEGMVLDFGVVKTIYRTYVEPYVEHRNLNETLLGVLIPLSATIDTEPLTTCENVAAWILDVFERNLPKLGEWTPSVCIRLWETPTSFAEVGKAPWRQ